MTEPSQLIRNQCVNDGRVESGEEVRSADLLRTYLEGPGLEFAQFEPEQGLASLVARIEESDPSAPTLYLVGHTDVVLVTRAGGRRCSTYPPADRQSSNPTVSPELPMQIRGNLGRRRGGVLDAESAFPRSWDV